MNNFTKRKAGYESSRSQVAVPPFLRPLPETVTETLLRGDLKAEIERAKTLTGRASSKPPPDINHQAAVTSSV
jgi:hypothetical protein